MQSKERILKIKNETILDYTHHSGKEVKDLISFYVANKDFLTPTIYVIGYAQRDKPLIKIDDEFYTPDDVAKEVISHCANGSNDIVLLIDYAGENGFAAEFATALDPYLKKLSGISLNTKISSILACKEVARPTDDIKYHFSTFGLKNYVKISMPKNEVFDYGISNNMFSSFYHKSESAMKELAPLQATLSAGFIGFEK